MIAADFYFPPSHRFDLLHSQPPSVYKAIIWGAKTGISRDKSRIVDESTRRKGRMRNVTRSIWAATAPKSIGKITTHSRVN
jgi:hypothetical protein